MYVALSTGAPACSPPHEISLLARESVIYSFECFSESKVEDAMAWLSSYLPCR